MNNKELQEKFGITNINEVSIKNIDSIINARSENLISENELQKILYMIPPEIISDYFSSYKEMASNIKDTQLVALNNISSVDFNKYVDILKELLNNKNCNTEIMESVIKLIDKLATLEHENKGTTNDTNERINNDNNETWKNILMGLGAGVIGIIGAGAYIYTKKDV